MYLIPVICWLMCRVCLCFCSGFDCIVILKFCLYCVLSCCVCTDVVSMVIVSFIFVYVVVYILLWCGRTAFAEHRS